jgi:transcriptional regulator with XRE-family HTH domain
MKENVGNYVNSARISMHLTARELSRKLGISRSYLTLIETGARPIPRHLIPPLSRCLKIPKKTIKGWYLMQFCQEMFDQKSKLIMKYVLQLSPSQKSLLLSFLKKIQKSLNSEYG